MIKSKEEYDDVQRIAKNELDMFKSWCPSFEMTPLTQAIRTIEALRNVARAAGNLSYVGPANDYRGKPLEDYVIVLLETANTIHEALDALPAWVLEEEA